ncbi:MAG TPA: MerR family DNA-binding protein [Blastocatellia bacterium]|nr:MerR family DNA-binding protein [Blastocatellia bacterium]
MRIGEVAGLAKVNVQTVRLYERIGLLKKPSRLPSGYRSYEEDAPAMIRFIKRAQRLGFSLAEIKSLLSLRDRGDGAASQAAAIARARISQIDEKIHQLNVMRDAILAELAECRCDGNPAKCVLIAVDR